MLRVKYNRNPWLSSFNVTPGERARYVAVHWTLRYQITADDDVMVTAEPSGYSETYESTMCMDVARRLESVGFQSAADGVRFDVAHGCHSVMTRGNSRVSAYNAIVDKLFGLVLSKECRL